jgi:drug/metabolite transporter (DMT)-like permease
MDQQNTRKGAFLLIASLWVLSVLDTTGKWVQAAGVSLIVLLCVRYGVHAILLSLYAGVQRNNIRWAVRSKKIQLVRGLLMLLSSAMFFKTLSLIPLAEATTVNFLAPLITLALSPWLLKEPSRWYRWLGVTVAFIGVLLVLRPGAASFNFAGTTFAIGTAMVFSLYQMATRLVATDDPIVTNLWGGWTGTIASICIALLTWTTPTLTAVEWLILISTGLSGLIGHLLQVSAFRHAAANALAPFFYFQIIAALFLGWAIFGQVPDILSYLGMGLIVSCGLWVAHQERQSKRKF